MEQFNVKDVVEYEYNKNTYIGIILDMDNCNNYLVYFPAWNETKQGHNAWENYKHILQQYGLIPTKNLFYGSWYLGPKDIMLTNKVIHEWDAPVSNIDRVIAKIKTMDKRRKEQGYVF